MKNYYVPFRNHTQAIVATFLLLFFGFSINTFGQESSVKNEVRVRYISSAPRTDSKSGKPGIKFVKKPRYSKASKSPNNLAPTDFKLERKAFTLINEKRAKHGLAPLTWSDDAAKLARIHSKNMAKHEFFSHVGLNGRLVDQRAIDFGIGDWKSIGENIAFCKGFSNPADFVVKRWMISDGHRKNLLHRMWRESGIGMAKTTEGKYFFTQIFILR